MVLDGSVVLTVVVSTGFIVVFVVIVSLSVALKMVEIFSLGKEHEHFFKCGSNKRSSVIIVTLKPSGPFLQPTFLSCAQNIFNHTN